MFVATEGLKTGDYSVYVYDMMGRQVQAQNNIKVNPGESIPVNVSGVAPGEYMLRISGSDSNRTAPFVVTH